MLVFTVCSLGAYWLVTGPDAPGCSGWPPLQGVGALPCPSSPEVVPIWSDWVPDQESLVACASCVDPNSDLHLLYGHCQCSNLHLDIFFLTTVERYSAGSSTSTRCAAMDIYWVLPASVCLPSWSPIWLSLLDTLPLCYPWSTSQGLYQHTFCPVLSHTCSDPAFPLLVRCKISDVHSLWTTNTSYMCMLVHVTKGVNLKRMHYNFHLPWGSKLVWIKHDFSLFSNFACMMYYFQLKQAV